MTTIDKHKRALGESVRVIRRCIDEGVQDSPRTIGFNCSVGSVDLLSIYLQHLGKITSGKVVNHAWFKPPQVGQKKQPVYEEKLPFDFPRREEVFELMCRIEERRNKLIYGKSSRKEIEEVLESFWKLKEIVEGELGEHAE